MNRALKESKEIRINAKKFLLNANVSSAGRQGHARTRSGGRMQKSWKLPLMSPQHIFQLLHHGKESTAPKLPPNHTTIALETFMQS